MQDTFLHLTPIILCRLLLQPKNAHAFGLDMKDMGVVVSKWYHDVPMSARRFSALETEGFCEPDVTLLRLPFSAVFLAIP